MYLEVGRGLSGQVEAEEVCEAGLVATGTRARALSLLEARAGLSTDAIKPMSN